jgi:FkbM family methyltransferase
MMEEVFMEGRTVVEDAVAKNMPTEGMAMAGGSSAGNVMRVEKAGKVFDFYNTIDIPALIDEVFSDTYEVFSHNISFSPGDVIVDAGANEGVFSIMMAKMFPDATVIALEPVVNTYKKMVANMQLNAPISNLKAFNFGLGGESGYMDMIVSKDHTGGSSSIITFVPSDHIRVPVRIVTLDNLFNIAGIDKIKLLKMDIEGMEYETLYASKSLSKIELFTGEVHINGKLEYRGFRPDGLCNWLGHRVKIIHVNVCPMAQ